MPYSVCSVHSRSLSEAKIVLTVMCKSRLACFVLSHCAPRNSPDLAKMWLGWLRELLKQGRALQGCHAISKVEVSEVTEIKQELKKVVCTITLDHSSNLHANKWSFFYSSGCIVRCSVFSNLDTLYFHLAASSVGKN